MSRAGLAAEVPPVHLCREMDAVPVLREAFKDTVFSWQHRVGGIGSGELVLYGRSIEFHCEAYKDMSKHPIPAPTVREMLCWLLVDPARLTDPDALARICIEASKEMK